MSRCAYCRHLIWPWERRGWLVVGGWHRRRAPTLARRLLVGRGCGVSGRVDAIYDAALPIADARKLPRDHPGTWLCRCGAMFLGPADIYPDDLHAHARFRAEDEPGPTHDPGLARFRPDRLPAAGPGLREALAEWDAIDGTSLADQFRAFVAAGKMADAIRAALASEDRA